MSSAESPPRTSIYTNRRLGLLADWFDEPYQQTILNTTEHAVLQRGSSLLAFSGGIVGSSNRGSLHRHRIFDWLGNIDGAILLAGTMVNQLGAEALSQLLQRVKDIPCCSIGVELPGVPSIVIDNQSGIHQAVAHLVDRHGCRRIGFIRGPQQNKEAESRFEAYRAALARAGIPYDEAQVYQGDFLRSSGQAAAEHWMQASNLPEALVAANDEMALGALSAFSKAGVHVPNDIRLIGFDDQESARHATPPLTTVRQPLPDLAIAAVRTLMDQIVGREVPQLQQLQAHLIMRESCGCELRLSSTGQSISTESKPAAAGDFSEAFARRRQMLRAEMTRAARGDFHHLENWEERLLSRFGEQLTSGGSAFIDELKQQVAVVFNHDEDVSRWHDIVTALRRVALPCCTTPELRTLAEDMLDEARLVTTQAVERAQAQKRFRLERFMRTLVEVGSALTASYDLDALARSIRSELPRLGVTACYVAVYQPFELKAPDSNPPRAQLVAAFDGQESLMVSSLPFEAPQLAPDALWPPARLHRMTVLPLFLKEHDLGFAVLEGPHGSLSEMIRSQLSIALYGALLARAHPPELRRQVEER